MGQHHTKIEMTDDSPPPLYAYDPVKGVIQLGPLADNYIQVSNTEKQKEANVPFISNELTANAKKKTEDPPESKKEEDVRGSSPKKASEQKRKDASVSIDPLLVETTGTKELPLVNENSSSVPPKREEKTTQHCDISPGPKISLCPSPQRRNFAGQDKEPLATGNTQDEDSLNSTAPPNQDVESIPPQEETCEVQEDADVSVFSQPTETDSVPACSSDTFVVSKAPVPRRSPVSPIPPPLPPRRKTSLVEKCPEVPKRTSIEPVPEQKVDMRTEEDIVRQLVVCIIDKPVLWFPKYDSPDHIREMERAWNTVGEQVGTSQEWSLQRLTFLWMSLFATFKMNPLDKTWKYYNYFVAYLPYVIQSKPEVSKSPVVSASSRPTPPPRRVSMEKGLTPLGLSSLSRRRSKENLTPVDKEEPPLKRRTMSPPPVPRRASSVMQRSFGSNYSNSPTTSRREQ